MTSDLTMISSPGPHFGIMNIEEEMKQSYVEAYRKQFDKKDVPDDKLVEAIMYLSRLEGGIEANRSSSLLIQAVDHIENLMERPHSKVSMEYSFEEICDILVKENNYPMEDIEKLVKEFRAKYGFLPSPAEFVDLYHEKKGIVHLEEVMKKTNEALGKSQIKVKEIEQEVLESQQIIMSLKQQHQQEKQDIIQQKERMLGEKDRLLQQMRQGMWELEQGNIQKHILELVEENQHLSQRLMCKICKVEEVQVSFSPCNHLISCQGCVPKLPKKKCPVCRENIKGTIRMYLS